MLTLPEYLAERKGPRNKFFPASGGGSSNRTVMLSSYIWWTELIGFALTRLGCNVLMTEPWFCFYTDDARFAAFDQAFDWWVRAVKQYNVQLVIGGNTTVMVAHPRTLPECTRVQRDSSIA